MSDNQEKFNDIRISSDKSFYEFLHNYVKVLRAGDYKIGNYHVRFARLCNLIRFISKSSFVWGLRSRGLYIILNKKACIRLLWLHEHDGSIYGNIYLCERKYGMWIRTCSLAKIGNNYVSMNAFSVRMGPDGKPCRLDSEGIFNITKSIVYYIAEAYDMYAAADGLAASVFSRNELARISDVIRPD